MVHSWAVTESLHRRCIQPYTIARSSAGTSSTTDTGNSPSAPPRRSRHLEDDLTGEALEDGAGGTVTFALDGISYEIDLSDDNAAEMREALSRYTAAARKVTTSGRRQSSSGAAPKRATGGGRTDLAAIREWAKANGREVSERGRIAGAVVEAYDAAH